MISSELRLKGKSSVVKLCVRILGFVSTIPLETFLQLEEFPECGIIFE